MAYNWRREPWPTTLEKSLSLIDECHSLHSTTTSYERYYADRNALRTYITVSKVIFNEPATIVLWSDGSKTVVKVTNNEKYDPEKGLAMAIAKKALGNDYKKIFKNIGGEV